jgi:non-ribosomal peptide synthetase component E (peptide arylation enzyme)
VVATRDVDLDTIRKDLRSKIAVYKIPRALRVYSTIPRNAMGKIAKKVRSPESEPGHLTERFAVSDTGEGGFPDRVA